MLRKLFGPRLLFNGTSESAVTIIPYFKGFYIAMNKSIGGVSAHPMTYMWLDRAHRKA